MYSKSTKVQNKRHKLLQNELLNYNSREYWKNLFSKLESEVLKPDLLSIEDLKLITDSITFDTLYSILFENINAGVTRPRPKVLCSSKLFKKNISKKLEPSDDSLKVLESGISVESKRSTRSAMVVSINEEEESDDDEDWDVTTETGTQLLENPSNFYRTAEEENVQADIKQRRISRRLTRPDALFDFDDFVEPEFVKETILEKQYFKIYKNFMTKPTNKVRIWRPQPLPTYENMDLCQKAEYVTEQIATNFINWMNTLNKNYPVSITTENLIKMFEIGSQNQLASTLDMKMEEMPTLPRRIAHLRNVPHLAKEEVLRQQIERDILAAKRAPKIFVFGSRLPAEEQIRPHLNETAAQWHKTSSDKKRGMEEMWKGITHLRSTKEYCKYMKTVKTKVEPPQYLVQKGLFKETRDDSSSSSSSESES